VGSFFDLRVEALNVDPATATISIDVTGPNGPAQILQGTPERTSPAADILAVSYPRLNYDTPGAYTVSARVTSGGQSAQSDVTNTVVVGTNSGKKAKNVIFFLGDGMGSAPITAARILSKGMSEGRYDGMLEMDRMDYRGMVTTSGSDSISTDSANSMSAYMCGQKSAVNAMGVSAASDPDPSKHPHQETMAEILKRTRGMSIGIVTTAEVQDATPAAVFAHTRRRSEYQDIMDQALKAGAPRPRGSSVHPARRVAQARGGPPRAAPHPPPPGRTNRRHAPGEGESLRDAHLRCRGPGGC
jgi:alkaline phosphatase